MECGEDDASPGEYGMIAQCSDNTFIWNVSGEDAACSATTETIAYTSGECALEYEEKGVKYYAILTITKEASKSIYTTLAWTSLLTAMAFINIWSINL